jgi:hypothetical protein
MRRSISLSAAVSLSLSLLALPAIGQEDGGNVVVIHCLDAQPGAQMKLEEGMKKHVEWHQKQKDTWSWYTWTVLTGPDTDQLCTGTFGHKWEDFDKPAVSPEADRADAMATIAPFASNHEASFWVRLPEVSRPAEEPAPMNTAIFFSARQGMGDDLAALVGEFHKAIEKTGVPWRYNWYRLASGGQEGTFVLVLPRPNFAAFTPTGKTFDEVLEEAYGKAGAEGLDARWDKVVERTETELSRARPDLSYIPEP